MRVREILTFRGMPASYTRRACFVGIFLALLAADHDGHRGNGALDFIGIATVTYAVYVATYFIWRHRERHMA